MTTLCGSCGFENPPGMRFCGNCGTRLDESDALEKEPRISPFTPEFGTMMGADLVQRLHQAGIEAIGQRRNTTVLFADISGSTALSERIDGEDYYNLLQEYIRVLSNNVYKYEGVVDKIIGDGLMALFGAPISHENNAERAVRAALDMQKELHSLSRKLFEEMGIDLGVRIGLHAGSVIIGGFGSDNQLLNYTAVGDTVNLAHRIEEAAPPGTILISETVYNQVRAIFDCQQISVLNPKGVAHPVVAYRVLDLRARPGSVRGIEGFYAPMIGRDQELIQLKQAAQDLIANHRGQLALISGEAGLGKSRLTVEFKAWLSQYRFLVLEGQSLAYRRVSYWLIREVLYSYLELPSTTPPLQTRERLSRYMYQLLGNQADEMLPFLEQLMSLPFSNAEAGERLLLMEAEQLRQQIFLAVRDFLSVEADHRPILLILEDLHWADEASLDLVVSLLDLLRQKPIFILAILRTIQGDELERMKSWGEQNLGERFQNIQLQNLSLEQSKQLLQLLLSIPDLPEKFRAHILLRAAGIPFYLEEILRMLIDQGVLRHEMGRWNIIPGEGLTSLGVPDTLKDLILTRFDSLQPLQRQILQVASVIGRDFSLPILSAVLQKIESHDLHNTIDKLVEREFILPQPGAPDIEYSFRHVLMSDAIYSTVLRKERSALHGQVADTIERIYADRLDDQIELLANHYRWSPRLDRALHYLLLAGQKAERNQANQQARQHYEAALELLPKMTPSVYQKFQVHTGMGDVLLFTGDYTDARNHYTQALDAFSLDADNLFVQERSSLRRKIARTFERQGDYDQAQNQLFSAIQTQGATSSENQAERAQVWNDLAWIDFRRGNYAEADDLLRKTLSLVENSNAYDVVASIYNRLGGVAYNLGDWESAAAHLRKSIAIRESAHDLVNLATSLNNLGLLEFEMGQYDNALENLTRSYELKSRLGQAEGISMALNNLGWLRVQRGELKEASQVLESALEYARQIGYTSLHCQVLATFSEMHLAAEDWEQARQVLNEAIRMSQDRGPSDELADLYRQMGQVAIGEGDCQAAVSWAKKAGESFEALGEETRGRNPVIWAEYLCLRGRLATCQGNFVEAQEYLDKSKQSFEKARSRLGQGRVLYYQGDLARAQGNTVSASDHYQQAEASFRSIGARLEAERAREAVLSVSQPAG